MTLSEIHALVASTIEAFDKKLAKEDAATQQYIYNNLKRAATTKAVEAAARKNALPVAS